MMMRRLVWLIVILLVPVGFVVAQDGTRPAIIIEAEIDNPTPYVGEQVIYSVRIFNTTTSAPDYTTPPFEGFWSAGTLGIEKYEEAEYGVTLIETVLFPLRAGVLTIPPGRLEFSPNQVYQAESTVVSNEVNVSVEPLPEPQPPDFTGAVGGPFFMTAAVDNADVNQGEPIALQVRLEGAGNLEQLVAPSLPVSADWRVYELPSQFEPSADDRRYIGTKQYNWMVVPPVAGTVEVPPLSMSYFDTNLLAYQTITTDPILLSVLPVEGAQAPTLDEIMVDMQPGMLPLKPVAMTEPRLWHVNRFVWLLPPGAFALVLFWRGFGVYRRQSQVRNRERNALRRARLRLQGLARYRKDDEQIYLGLVDTVLGYFSDRWNMPAEQLDMDRVQAELVQYNVPYDVIERLMGCVQVAQEERYSPDRDVPPPRLVQETAKALAAVDTAMRS